jgi:hypothetical protein
MPLKILLQREDSCLVQVAADLFFVVIFALEAMMKITVYGLLFSSNAYLKSAWNVLDFVTVVVGIVLACLGQESTQLSSLRSLRTLRALRPIRMASRAPGMKVQPQSFIPMQTKSTKSIE